jgi:hypothetical protein
MAQGLLDCPVKPGNDSEGFVQNRRVGKAKRAHVRPYIMEQYSVGTARRAPFARPTSPQNSDAWPSSFLGFAARGDGAGSGTEPNGAMTAGESFAVRFTAVEIS